MKKIIKGIFFTATLAVLATGCSDGGSGGSSGNSGVVLETTTPGSMSDLWAAPAGSNQIDLIWASAIDDTSTSSAMVYEICQSMAEDDCYNFTVSATTAAGANSYSVMGLTANTDYYFKVRAKDEAGNVGASSIEAFATTDLDNTVNAPTFDPIAKTYGIAQSVAISTTTGGAAICYTADGTTPACDVTASCTVGALYADVVAVDTTQTINAIACLAGSTDSGISSASYVIDVTAPDDVTGLVASPAGDSQIILNWTAVTDNASAAANIVYEICQSSVAAECENFTVSHATAPGVNSYTVTGLSALTDYYFQVRSKDEVGNVSVTEDDVMATTDPSGTVNAPGFNIVAGMYESDQSIELSTTTTGATIYYTLDGTNPSLSSAEYTGAIPVAGDGTSIMIKAIADEAEMVASAIATATYDIKYPVTSVIISVANSNTVALTDFQVRVDIGSFIFTRFSGTGDEVRFYHDGKELSYYVESFDKKAQRAIYWVKVDSLAASTTTEITLSPFKAGLAAGSNGKNTFAFFDDFNGSTLDTSVWNSNNTTEGNYSVSGGVLTLTGAPTDSWVNGGNFYVKATDLPGLTSTDAFTADARILRTAIDGHMYANGVRASSSNYSTHRGLWLRHGVPYNYVFAGAVNTGAWRVYQVKVNADNDITYKWGSTFGSWDNSLIQSRVPGPTFDISFSMDGYRNTGLQVDYVRVRKYAAVDPTASYFEP